MSNEIVAISVQEQEGQLVVDSRLVADLLGIQHESFLKTIRKHRERVEASFGSLRFEIGTLETAGGKQETTYVWLTEPQASVLMTLSRNTDQVVDCKINLVAAFEKAKAIIKTVIPAQNEELETLRLQVKVRELDNTMLVLHGKETVLALRGLSNQIVQSDRPILEVVNKKTGQHFSGQTCKQVAEYVQKRTGKKLKSGADVERFLRTVGRDDLIEYVERPGWQACIPKANLSEVYDLLTDGDRQRLIGE